MSSCISDILLNLSFCFSTTVQFVLTILSVCVFAKKDFRNNKLKKIFLNQKFAKRVLVVVHGWRRIQVELISRDFARNEKSHFVRTTTTDVAHQKNFSIQVTDRHRKQAIIVLQSKKIFETILIRISFIRIDNTVSLSSCRLLELCCPTSKRSC